MKVPTNLAELIQHTAEQAQRQEAEKLAAAQLKLLTTSYDKAASYTTVVIFGGYAGLFALWQLTKEHLSREQVLWSGLLLVVSLVAFVFFEVTKMVLVSRQVFRKARALENPENRRNLHKLVAILDGMEQSYVENLKPLFAFWAITVGIAVSGAVGGAGILVYSFVAALWNAK